MFGKAIFKQTLRQNWKLWLIFTLVASGIAAAIINTFDPHAMRLAMQAFGADGPPAGMGGGPFGTGTSRFGLFTIPDLMASGYYAMLGLIMPLVYVVVTANALIATQIDRGAMAYTLSTPVTRTKVVFTKALYLVLALLAMFSAVTVAGLATSQLAHNALWGRTHTADALAAAEVLDINPAEVPANTQLILEHPEAMAAGATARGVSQDVYAMYLELLLIHNTIDEIAKIMDVPPAAFLENPSMIYGNREVYEQISEIFGADIDMLAYRVENAMPRLVEETIENPVMILAMMHGLDHHMQDIEMDTLMIGAEAAAEYLEMEVSALMMSLQTLANDPSALAVASEASGIDEEALQTLINVQLVESEFEFDQGIYFNLGHFLNLNIGIFLLMFAIGGVSFLFSCVFNLSRNSLALGAGLPFAFFLLNMMASLSPDFASLRFFTLNTLYNPMDIVRGYAFTPQFITLTAIGAVLYSIGIAVFKRKDLAL